MTTTTDPLWQATVDVADYLADLWPRIPALTAPEIGTWHRELEHAKVNADEVIPLAMRYRDAGHDFPPHSVSSLLKYLRPLREDNARRADRTYQTEQPALPASTAANWAEWCRTEFGRKRTFGDVVQERHATLAGCAAPECDLHPKEPA